MLIAEQRNRLSIVEEMDVDCCGSRREVERMEDVLTSNVFGVMKNLPVTVLNGLLEMAGVPLMDEGLQWDFWPFFENEAEPDVVVTDKNRTLVIEVKYLSESDKVTSDRQPQLLREYQGAMRLTPKNEVTLLTITRNENLDWEQNVSGSLSRDREELSDLAAEGRLRYLSWQQVLSALRDQAVSTANDPVTQRFLGDVVAYLEYKFIGVVRSAASKDRGMSFFFGDEVRALEDVLREHNFKISLSSLADPEKKRVLGAIREYVERASCRLSNIGNTIDADSIPISLLLDKDGMLDIPWSELVQFLIAYPKVDFLWGRNVSARVKFQVGNYVKSPVSLFTYDFARRELTFQETR